MFGLWDYSTVEIEDDGPSAIKIVSIMLAVSIGLFGVGYVINSTANLFRAVNEDE